MRCSFSHRKFLLLPGIIISFLTSAQLNKNLLPGQIDSTYEYFIYRPAGYNSEQKYPLVIFLDPAARGMYPLNLYRAVADSMKILFGGSRKSKNFDPASSEESIINILNELPVKYSIDTSMIFLAGFSGGARAASALAGRYAQIKGVIACGAGLADDGKFGVNRKVPLAGIVGNRDMNFEEMIRLQEVLTKQANPNILIYHEAGHQWPPVECFAAGLNWIVSLNNPIRKQAYDKMIWSLAVAEKDSGRLYLSSLMASEFRKISALQEQADSFVYSISKQDGFKKDEREFRVALEEERKYMDEFTLLFNSIVFTAAPLENTVPFKEESSKLDSWSKGRKKYFRLAAIRCRDLCWRLCAEYYGQFVMDKNFQQADKLARISEFFQSTSASLKRFNKSDQ